MKKSLKGGVLFLLFFLFFSNVSLYAKKDIFIGIYDNPPLSYINASKKPDGLFPSILNIIAKEKELNLVYKKCKWVQCLKMLSNGDIDILSPIARTPQREKRYLFADETILTNFGTLYAKQKTPIKSWTDLNNKKVGLLKGDIHANMFLNNIKDFKINASIIYFDSYKKMFESLNKKELDAIVSNSIIFLTYQKKFPHIKKTDIIIDQIPITFAYNKNNIKLKKTIDKALKNYEIDIYSPYYQILHRYLNVKVEKNRYLKYTLIALALLVVFLVILFIINQTLHKMVDKATKIINEKYQKELYLNKIINTVKNVNQVLLLDIPLKEKISMVCEKIIEEELYEVSCIALEKHKKLNIITSTKNFPKGYEAQFDTNDNDNPVVQSFNQSKTVIKKFIKDDCFFKKRIETKNLTYILATPIMSNHKKTPFGVLIVYTINKNGFRKKEINLIEELAGDISLCMNIEHLKQKNLNYLNDRIKNYKEMVYSLNKAIEARDPYTAGHNTRVSKYATLIAKQMKLSDTQIEALQKAGELHDIGKIETPDSILLKPGKLNEYEYDIIKMHPKKGYEILSHISFLKDAAQIVLYHHERYDGSGYPYGLKKDDIPLLSQILSIADTFDAMTTNRIYKPAKSKENALKEIKSLANIWFDKKIVDITLQALKDVILQQNSTFEQTPKDPLLDARFAYFFKDHLTECYNSDYLKHLYIIKELQNFNYIYTIAIKNFTNFNKTFSWEKGDEFLIQISKELQKRYNTEKIFRVKGDDFMIVSKNRIDIEKTLSEIFEQFTFIRYFTKTYPIKEIQTLQKLKELIRDI